MELREVLWDCPESMWPGYELEYDRRRYDKILEHLFEILGEHRWEVDRFRFLVNQFINENKGDYRELVEWVFNDDDICQRPRVTNRLTAKDIIFNPKKLRQCENCGSIFYDLSRNGRTAVCHYVTNIHYDHQDKRHVFSRDKENRIKSVCQTTRDNKTNRKSYNKRVKNREYDGYVDRGSNALTWSEFKAKASLNLAYDPYEESKAYRMFARKVEAIPSEHSTFKDPQDIICGEAEPTHRPSTKTTRRPLRFDTLKNYDSPEFFRVSIESGVQTVVKEHIGMRRVVFENKLLPIKTELPKIPKQTYELF